MFLRYSGTLLALAHTEIPFTINVINVVNIRQWLSTWVMHTPGGIRRHLKE
jgi:hypothetical protein